MKKTPKSVASYISSSPKEAQAKLKEIRAAIRQAAPEAIERISYGMPYYEYGGRLAYFRLAKAHIGLYVPPPIIAQHKSELAEYETTQSTVRIPLGKKIPSALIKKLVQARMKFNNSKK